MQYAVVKYSHHFSVRAVGREMISKLLMFSRTFSDVSQFSKDEHGNPKVIYFAAGRRDGSEFRFHINSFDSFLEFATQQGFIAELVISDALPYIPAPANFTLNPKIVPFDYQHVQIDYMANHHKTGLVQLQTGGGKTLCALFAAAKINKRTLLVIRPNFIHRWIPDIKNILGCHTKDILAIQGSADLRNLIALAKADELDAKFIVISNRTLHTFLTSYRENTATDLYGCEPYELMALLKIGFKIIDEVHLDFHFNFRFDLFTHLAGPQACLSASLVNHNRTIQRMYKIMFPPKDRQDAGEFKKYIKLTALFYNHEFDTKLRWTRKYGYTYSHNEYEMSIMKQKKKLNRYCDMIASVVENCYVPVRQDDQRMLIFCSTKAMCGHVTEHLTKKFSTIPVTRYIGGDSVKNLEDGRIIVSTLQSSGTAVDIADLRIALNTVAIDSPQANIQAVGRLRIMRKYPDVNPEFYYFTCRDIPTHMSYHKRKASDLQDKVLSSHEMELGMSL